MPTVNQQQLGKALDRLCLAMGRALWEIQGCEQMFAKYYCVAFHLKGKTNLEQMIRELEVNFKHTSGELLRLFNRATNSRSELSARLEAFIDERNWLAHRVRRLNFSQVLDAAAFPDLLQRINALKDEANSLILLFHNLLIDYFISLGVPREEIEQSLEEEHQRLMARRD